MIMLIFRLRTPKVFVAFIFTNFSSTVIEDVHLINASLTYRSNIKLNGTVESVQRMGTIFILENWKKALSWSREQSYNGHRFGVAVKNLRYVIKQIEKRKRGNNNFRDIGTDILGKDVVELYEPEKALT